MNKLTTLLLPILAIPTILMAQNDALKILKSKNDLTRYGNYYVVRKSARSDKAQIVNSEATVLYDVDPKDKIVDINNAGFLILGTYTGGFNDGGGMVNEHFKEVRFIDLKQGNAIKSINYELIPTPRDPVKVYRIIEGGRIGLINSKGEMITEPKYKLINEFNRAGEAIAFLNDEILVLDSLGKKKYDTHFKHTVEPNTLWQVFDHKMFASNDGKHFGLYDLSAKKELIPYEYDEIKFFNQSAVSFPDILNPIIGKKDNLIEVINATNYSIELPASIKANGVNSFRIYNKKPLINYSFANSDFTNVYYGKPLFAEAVKLPNFASNNMALIPYQKADGTFSVYHIDLGKDIMKNMPGMKTVHLVKTVDDNEDLFEITADFSDPSLGRLAENMRAIFNSEAKVKVPFTPDATINVIKLPDNKRVYITNFKYNQRQSRAVNIYDDKLTEIIILANLGGFEVKNGILIVKDDKNFVKNGNLVPSYGLTGIDGDGKIVGERFNYVPK